MKGNDIYDVKETKESLHMIRKKYNQTKLDDSFQRRGGMEPWLWLDKEGFRAIYGVGLWGCCV